MSAPESQSDDCNVICPYCLSSYQAEAEDYNDRERDETCFKCKRVYTVWQEFEVTHHTQPKPETPEG